MIAPHRINREHRKLLFSLGTIFMTRIPGAVGVLWFLPLLRFGLGTEDYANLLSAMGLAIAATFLINGFSIFGRRLIGEAYANGDRVGEADGFASLVCANALALALALAIIAAFCTLRDSGTAVLIVSMLPAIGIFLTTFDNVRSAYNEHYVTATAQFVLQVGIYTIGFLLPAVRHSLILAALVLQGHAILSSLITLGLLLRDRAYLLTGRPVAAWRVIREGTIVAMAEGLLTATLSLSMVWLQTTASATTSAWFATIVRLFQTFLTPVILLLMPLSSYIRLSWNGKTFTQQQTLAKVVLMIGLGYGALVALALLLASQLYVDRLLHLPAPGGLLQVLPCFLLFGAIIAYKSYSSIAYLVLDGASHLSSWTTVAITAAAMLGAATSFAVDSFSVISVYAVATSLSMILVLCWNAARFVLDGNRLQES
ncbi:hypothetical protein [Rhodopila sp.]|uniref:hypothetical protein n=1 Tax=Rhodopila sp. TaxID=2480087 RepID=UPI003D12579D